MFNIIKTVFLGSLLVASGLAGTQNLDLCKGSDSYICNGNLGIPRREMPQLDDDTLKNFFTTMSANGFKTEFRELDPFSLYPIQNELNGRVIEKMERTGFDPCKERRILVHCNDTNHLQVVDGHHRWAACLLKALKNLESGTTLSAWVIHNVTGGILKTLKNFPGVSSIGFNDH